jgi:hypothetical protein
MRRQRRQQRTRRTKRTKRTKRTRRSKPSAFFRAFGAQFAPTAAWIPDSALPSVHPDSINSIVRKTLLATPEFPILYADMILSTRPNSHEAKILAPKYQEIIARVNDMQTPKTCTHIKISGVRCGSPALRQQEFCYYHQRMHRGVRTPPQARLHPIALIEDRESIQVALMEVLNGLMRNTIELKRAALMLRALHIAVKNAGHKDFASKPSQMVKEVPEYGELSVNDSAALRELDIPFEASFGQDPRYTRPERHYKTPEESARARGEKIANYYGFPTAEAHAAAKQKGWTPLSPYIKTDAPGSALSPEPANARVPADAQVRPEPARVGADAFVRPSGPEFSVRSALTQPARDTSANQNRKPPLTVRDVKHATALEAAQRRNIPAHAARRG